MAALLPLYSASSVFPLPPPRSQQHVPPTSLLPPPLSLPGELTMAGHGPLKSSHGCLIWRASTKLVFHRGMTKTDAHNLPLANPALNFI
jgi:hypothetical protein